MSKSKEQIQAEIDKLKAFLDKNVPLRDQWLEEHQAYEERKIAEIKEILLKANVLDQVQAIDSERLGVKERLATHLAKYDGEMRAVFKELQRLEEELETAPTALELKRQRYQPISDALYATDPRTREILDRITVEKKEDTEEK